MQLKLLLPQRGGRRKGAGRPRHTRELPHIQRPNIPRNSPHLVTVRIREGLPSMREQVLFRRIRESIRHAKERLGLRITQFSIQSNHVHLIVEAEDKNALTSGMKGLGVRIARGVNGVLRIRGQVIGDRYHARTLTTPSHARIALRYVLCNFRHHGAVGTFDRASSAAAFEGWTFDAKEHFDDVEREVIERSIAPPKTWLLRVGWYRYGRIDPFEVPG